jgi:hypothetical protein
MPARILSLAVTFALLSAPMAFGANTASTATPTAAKSETVAVSPAKACGILQQQWDQVATHHMSDAKFAPARELRYEGGRLCSSGKPAAGVAKLEQALTDIGLKPRA